MLRIDKNKAIPKRFFIRDRFAVDLNIRDIMRPFFNVMSEMLTSDLNGESIL